MASHCMVWIAWFGLDGLKDGIDWLEKWMEGGRDDGWDRQIGWIGCKEWDGLGLVGWIGRMGWSDGME